MFRIKICGLTRIEDVHAAAEAGADAIGLNFYPKSPRFLSLEKARELALECPRGIARLGVFVNAMAAEIRACVEQVPLDAVQLHGDEPPSIMHDLLGITVIRAMRPREDQWKLVGDQVAEYRAAGTLAALLIDAHAARHYGGTGQSADWDAVVRHRDLWRGLPLILAGGLRPGNVADAIRAVHPYGVDTASGVESAPGVKDPALVRAFVDQAKSAFAKRQ